MKSQFLLLSLVGLPLLQAADSLVSKTTYADAYGKTKHTVAVDPEKDLTHYPAVPAAEAVATWKVKPGFALQLAAHEPQVRDPVAICFDERGRMFVCEMIDYSEMRDASPHLGRISVLEDRDGDGFHETSRVFADDLPWPTGLIWANGGLYVGATPDIWRFEDKDGDGRAEVRTRAFTGFGTGLKRLNVQGLLNSFQWGQDNRIHVLAGGGNRGLITSPLRPDLTGQELGGNDFWFDPRTHEFGLEAGGAQYGMSFDDFGRKFGCSNSDHLQHWVYGSRLGNGNAGLPSSRQSIAVDGGAAEVFRLSPDEPWRIIRTRWRIAGTVPGVVEGGGRVSGYFTGATGTTIYRGDAYGPELVNNSFTGDAGGQLIHRKIIRTAPDGVNLEGERPADERTAEFAASRDTWVRVVNFANAPDGCLHVCDMYREVIEHPWSIPDEIKRHLDLNHGNDRGRIYRIVPAAGAPRIGKPVNLAQAGSGELVGLLEHPNGWHRDTAHRLLFERQDLSVVPALEGLSAKGIPAAKLHALGLLRGLGALREPVLVAALGDPQPLVRERAVELAALLPRPGEALAAKLAALSADESPRVRFQLALSLRAWPASDSLLSLALRDHAHPWIGPAILSLDPKDLSRQLLDPFTRDPKLAAAAAPFVARLVEICAASESKTLIRFLAQDEPNPLWVRSFGEGLRRAKLSIRDVDREGKLAGLFQKAAERAADGSASAECRRAALEILSLAPVETWRKPVETALSARKDAGVQTAALKLLAAQSGEEITRMIVAHWPQYEAAEVQTAALDLLIARKDRLSALLQAIENGSIPGQALSAGQLQAVLRSSDAKLEARARQVLAAQIPPSRTEVIAKYQEAMRSKGDSAKGRAHFQQRCLTCHRAAGEGYQVGPDLITVKTKGREALLTAILDPAKEVAAQFVFYMVTTKEGETVGGLITEDNATAMTLRMPGGLERTLERAAIKGSSSSGASLMPEGLEAGMSPQDMADLLSFIEELP
ncbi:MAG: Glucose/arabinose dehydrogenase, beta-propeller fold [Verrucomicrobia bacterium]|nr:MAG: Glucose/arabinose dehydrogenase, beta-propeller fold [Verrucomicrobiota bacterium]